MRLLMIALLCLPTAAGLSGCDCGGEGYASDCLLDAPEPPEDEESASVRFRNQMVDTTAASSEEAALDLLISSESDPLFEAVEYSTGGSPGSARVELDQDTQTLSLDVRVSESGLAVFSNQSQQLQVESAYTVVAMGTLGVSDTYNLEVLRHDDQDPAENRVSMRFVNTLSETISPLEVVVDGDVEAAALAYADTSSYAVLDPDSGVIEAQLRDAQGASVATVSCNVTDGDTYTAILGYAGFDAVADDDIRLYCQRH